MQESYAAGFAMTDRVHDLSPRHILMSNFFGGGSSIHISTIPLTRVQSITPTNTGTPMKPARGQRNTRRLVSAQSKDSAAYVRECWNRFKEYQNWLALNEPMVRGEGGMAGNERTPASGNRQRSQRHVLPQEAWAHVGVLGYSCDGEWYPRLFVPYSGTQFPNKTLTFRKCRSLRAVSTGRTALERALP